MSPAVPPVIVMGVSGCGKSTVGALLAARLGARFLDADDLHPAQNKLKMAAGRPLDDADRAPWLRTVAAQIGSAARAGELVVVACSSLRRAYREVLRSEAPHTAFVHLAGTREVLSARQAARTHEFMPSSLLPSQLATLEPLHPDERGMVVDVDRAPADIVEEAAGWLRRLAAEEEPDPEWPDR